MTEQYRENSEVKGEHSLQIDELRRGVLLIRDLEIEFKQKKVLTTESFKSLLVLVTTLGSSKQTLAELTPRSESLPLFLRQAKATLLQEIQVTQQDIRFFDQHGKSSNVHQEKMIEEMISRGNPISTYEQQLKSLAMLDNLDPAKRHLVTQILLMGDALKQDRKSIVEMKKQLDAVKQLAMSCSYQTSKQTITFQEIIGSEHHAAFSAFKGIKTAEEFDQSLEALYQAIFNPQTIASLLYLTLSVHESDSAKEELKTFFETQFFNELSQIIHIISLLDSVYTINSSITSTTRKVLRNKVLARYFAQQVRSGKISSTFAREVFIDVQNENFHTLLVSYLKSCFSDLDNENDNDLDDVDKSQLQKQRKKLLRAIIVLCTLAVLATHPDSIQQLGSIFESAKNAIVQLPHDLISATLSRLGASESQQSFAAKTAELPKQPNNFTTDQLAAVQERNAALAVEKNARPLTADEITHPTSADGVAHDFQPSSVSLEGYRSAAASIVWEKRNFTLSTDLFETTIYPYFNQKTKEFERAYVPTTESGRELPQISFESLNTAQNVLIGERTEISKQWFDLPHQVNSIPSAASVFVFIDGKYAGVYSLEFLDSPLTTEQFLRPKIEEKDFKWIEDQRNGKQVSFQIAVQFEKNDQTLLRPQKLIKQPGQTEIALDDLPKDVQEEIRQLNASDVSDEDKIQAFVHWFTQRGENSFNPKDDQWAYVDLAIEQKRISKEEGWRYFLLTYFYGSDILNPPHNRDVSTTGLTPEAGECNRRNSIADFLTSFIRFKGDWSFQLESGFVDENGNSLTGGDAHMRLIADNGVGKRIIADVTGAPKTDESTAKLMSAVGNTPTFSKDGPTSATESQRTNDESAPNLVRYSAGPEVSKYPLIVPDISIPFDQTQYKFNNNERFYERYDVQPGKLPWTYVEYEPIEPFGYYEQVHILPMDFDGQKFTAKPEFTTVIPDYRLIEMKNGRKESYRDTILLQGTNIVPLRIYPGQELIASSVKVTSAGISLPSRLVFDRRTQKVWAAIDMPIEQLKNTTVVISYELSQEWYIHASTRANSIAVEDQMVHSTLRSFAETKRLLSKDGIAFNDALRMYLSEGLLRSEFEIPLEKQKLQNTSDVSTPTLDRMIADLQADSQIKPELVAILQLLRKTVQIEETTRDTHAFIDVLNELDKYFPDLIYEEYLKSDGKTTEDKLMDALSKFGIYSGPQISSQEVNDDLQKKRLRLVTILPVGSYRQNYMTLQRYLEVAILDKEYPFQNAAIFSTNTTEDASTYENCARLSTGNHDMMSCLEHAPYLNEFGRRYVLNTALSSIIDNFSPAPTTLDIYVDSQNPHAQLAISPYGEADAHYSSVSYAADSAFIGRNHYNDDSLTMDERIREFQIEKSKTEQWYYQSVLDALGRGNQRVWAEFMALFLSGAAASYGVLRIAAYNRRWAKHKTIADFYKKKTKNPDVLSKRLAERLKVSPKIYTPTDYDSAWKTSNEGSQVERTFLRQVVTERASTGQPLFPFQGRENQAIDNPWKSREVPPTYLTLVSQSLLNAENLVALFAPDNLDQEEKIRQLIVRSIERGIPIQSNQVDISSFLMNMKFFQNDQKSAWEETLAYKLNQELLQAGVDVEQHSGEISFVVQECTSVWQAVFHDWQMFHGASAI